MKKSIQKVVSGAAMVAVLAPGIAMAAGVADVLKTVSDLLNMVIPILLTVAIIFFMIGVIMYIMKPDEKDKAREQMTWGIIGIAVMVSIWGLVGILQSTFGIQGQNQYILPQVPTLQRGN